MLPMPFTKFFLFYVRLLKYLLTSCLLTLKAIIVQILRLPRYLLSANIFLASNLPVKPYPQLFDVDESASNLGEYFWQDLFVASRLRQSKTSSHADVGSRVDGFIAQLSHFTPVVLFDLRPLSNIIPNVTAIQADINHIPSEFQACFDSVSCLHTLEHIGLGRYGDPISLDDWPQAIRSLIQLLRPNGHLWISVPVGTPSVIYNAHRIFSPDDIPSICLKSGLEFASLAYVNSDGGVTVSTDIRADLSYLHSCNYHLAIYQFIRT